MTIKAVVRSGVIQPVEPLPADWGEGKEVIVEETTAARASAEVDQWAREMDAATAQISPEEHERFLAALDEIERESKEAVRKQWERP